jgi:hypothetical protein
MKTALIVAIVAIVGLVLCGVAILDVNVILAGISFLLAAFLWLVLDTECRYPEED